MGCTDSVAHAQAMMHQLFAQYIENFMTCWVDDILGYATDETTLLENLPLPGIWVEIESGQMRVLSQGGQLV